MATKRTQWSMIQSFAEVIDRFDGPAAFAREVGMTAGAAKQARRRNSISAEWFGAIEKAARRRGLQEISLRTLATLAEQKRLAS
jgi:hypothetical protein